MDVVTAYRVLCPSFNSADSNRQLAMLFYFQARLAAESVAGGEPTIPHADRYVQEELAFVQLSDEAAIREHAMNARQRALEAGKSPGNLLTVAFWSAVEFVDLILLGKPRPMAEMLDAFLAGIEDRLEGDSPGLAVELNNLVLAHRALIDAPKPPSPTLFPTIYSTLSSSRLGTPVTMPSD